MSYSTPPLTSFPIPLGIRAHQDAQRFRALHSHPDKAKQVYLNTLAVTAVQDYLAMMGYDSELSHSYSWQPVQQTLMDCADLMVQDYGRIECRSCLEGETEVLIPPEVWDDRIGYVIVQFSPSLREAQVLGVVSSVSQQRLSLEAIAPLEALSDLLRSSAQALSSTQEAASPQGVVTQLQGWFQSFQDSWQTVRQSVDFFLSSSELAYSYRNPNTSDETQTPEICRSKQVTLAHQQDFLDLSVFLGLKALPTSETDVWVKVSTQQVGLPLPTQLRMSILTPDQTEVMAAQSNGTEAMQFRFSAMTGEQFRLQIALENCTWQEDFVLS